MSQQQWGQPAWGTPAPGWYLASDGHWYQSWPEPPPKRGGRSARFWVTLGATLIGVLAAVVVLAVVMG